MVVDIPDEHADRIFHALADATRRDILRRAIAGEDSVSALARRYPMSIAAVQKHVAVLERAGLIAKERSGREQRVRSQPAGVRTALDLLEEIEEIWRGRLDRFGAALVGPTEGADP